MERLGPVDFLISSTEGLRSAMDNPVLEKLGKIIAMEKSRNRVAAESTYKDRRRLIGSMEALFVSLGKKNLIKAENARVLGRMLGYALLGIADLPRKEREAAYIRLFDDLAALYRDGDVRLFHGAPAAILVTSNTTTTDFHKAFHKADAEIAVTYGTIAAAGLGLASCRLGLSEMTFAADRKLREKHRIPGNERVDGVLALGYSDLEWRRIPPRGPVKAVWV